MKISFCTTCMGRAHHLRQTLPRNLADTVSWVRPEAVEFVVVDYSSPDDLVEWFETDPELAIYRERGILRLVRVAGQTHFRHSHAKNVAHQAATGDVVCNVDADNFVGPGFAAYLRAVFVRRPRTVVATSRLDRGLIDPRWQGCMGRLALRRSDFDALGGYDESVRFRGWAGEDSDLLMRAVRSRLTPVLLRDRRFLEVVTHSDLERIALTDHDDAAAELARVGSLDGNHVVPLLRYVVGRMRAPRVANAAAEG